MSLSFRARNTVFALLGASALVLKSQYTGPFSEVVFSYWGNLSASFAVYFIVRLTTVGRLNRAISAIIALLIVELFEATNGFGVMSNTYDSFDYVANTIGVAIAVVVDVIASNVLHSGNRSIREVDQDVP